MSEERERERGDVGGWGVLEELEIAEIRERGQGMARGRRDIRGIDTRVK